MDTQQRRQRFVEYYEANFEQNGGRAAFAARPKYTKGRISQLFDPKQPFGELVGARLAKLLGLRPGYFEWSRDGLSPKGLEVGRSFDALPEGPEKDRLLPCSLR